MSKTTIDVTHFDKELFQRFNMGATLTTLNVEYYRPDHTWLLQMFTWQTLDIVPHLPRIQQFLDFWRRDIEAVIKTVEVAWQDQSGRSQIMTPGFVATLH